jgi:hypothetical protein
MNVIGSEPAANRCHGLPRMPHFSGSTALWRADRGSRFGRRDFCLLSFPYKHDARRSVYMNPPFLCPSARLSHLAKLALQILHRPARLLPVSFFEAGNFPRPVIPYQSAVVPQPVSGTLVFVCFCFCPRKITGYFLSSNKRACWREAVEDMQERRPRSNCTRIMYSHRVNACHGCTCLIYRIPACQVPNKTFVRDDLSES